MTEHHTQKKNNRAFKQIVLQDGIAIHGFGAFGKAIAALLLRKISDLNIKGEITVLVRESISDVLVQTIEKSFQIALKEHCEASELLKLFFIEKQIDLIEENRKLLAHTIKPSINLKFISEKDTPEAFDAAIIGNKYHFLAIPSGQIEGKMDQLKNISNGEDLVFIDLAKGEHSIKAESQNNTVHVSGPNFASEIVAGKPSGADIGSNNPELRANVMKLLYSKNFRPYEQKDVKAVLEGGIWKNVLALSAGFLTKNSDDKEKAEIIASLFIKMLEWGEQNGIARKDLLGLAGIGDFYLCMNPKSRNFEAGREIHNCLGQTDNFDSLKTNVKSNIATRRGEEEITIESLETLKKYFNNPIFKNDPLIAGFDRLSNKKMTKAEIEEIKQEMIASLKVRKNSEINRDDLKFIKLIGHGVKTLTNKFGLRGNTESLILARSIPEIFSSLNLDVNNLNNNDLYIILENVLEIAFSHIYASEDKLKNILKDFPEDKINDTTRPILKTILSAVKNNFDKKIIQDLIQELMSRPIKMSV